MTTATTQRSAVSQIAAFLHEDPEAWGIGSDRFWRDLAGRFPNATLSEAFQAIGVAARIMLDEVAEQPEDYRRQVAAEIEALTLASVPDPPTTKTEAAQTMGWRVRLALAWQVVRGKL